MSKPTLFLAKRHGGDALVLVSHTDHGLCLNEARKPVWKSEFVIDGVGHFVEVPVDSRKTTREMGQKRWAIELAYFQSWGLSADPDDMMFSDDPRFDQAYQECAE